MTNKLFMSPKTKSALDRHFKDKDNKAKASLIERLLSTDAANIISRARKVRNLEDVKKGNKIPLELLNAALGWSPEACAEMKKRRRRAMSEKERSRRRAGSKRARASRRHNQQTAAKARRHRQKMSRRRAA